MKIPIIFHLLDHDHHTRSTNSTGRYEVGIRGNRFDIRNFNGPIRNRRFAAHRLSILSIAVVTHPLLSITRA